MPTICKCQNCEWTGSRDELCAIKDIGERVAPGEPMPAGECPDCGALAHEVDLPLKEGFMVRQNPDAYGNFNIEGETRESADLDAAYEERINACLKACAGISTEALEAGAIKAGIASADDFSEIADGA